MAARRVLITGVSSYIGSTLARRLESSPGVEHIVGVDREPASGDLKRTEVIEADISKPLLANLIPSTGVDTVIHLATRLEPGFSSGRTANRDTNVLGTLQLLRACESSETVKRVVVKSSASIYGCSPTAPTFIKEELAGRMATASYQRDILELESYIETFAKRYRAISFALLRFQPLVGLGVDNPLMRYLNLPVVPTHLGFDPLVQFTHEDDCIGALIAAVEGSYSGAVNIASSGTISLVRILRILGRVTVPLLTPLVEPFIAAAARVRGYDFGAELVQWIRYGRGVDLETMKNELGYRPEHDAESAMREIAGRSSSMRAFKSLREVVVGTG